MAEGGPPVQGLFDADGGGQKGFVQDDDGEESVALGDVVGMPGGPADGLGPEGDGVAERALSSVPVGSGGLQPEGDHGQAHDQVADQDDGEVAAAEGPGDAGGQDQDAGHLDEDGDPVGDVIVVVGRGEPGEIHPGHQMAKKTSG